MKFLECLIKKTIIDKLNPKCCITMIRKDGDEYFLERESSIIDGPVYMAMVQCYKIFGLNIQVLVYERENFRAFTYNRPEEKEFIIQHELAHIRLKHYKLNVEELTWEERLEIEKEADMMAAKKLSPEIGIKSLEQLRLFFLVLNESSDDQIEYRIENLRKMLEAN